MARFQISGYYEVNLLLSGGGPDQVTDWFWDDVLASIVVRTWPSLSDYFADTNGTDMSNGREITSSQDPGMVQWLNGEFGTYQFCEGTTLNRFQAKTDFPYWDRVETLNSSVCNFTNCDLFFVLPILTEPSSITQPDPKTWNYQYTWDGDDVGVIPAPGHANRQSSTKMRFHKQDDTLTDRTADLLGANFVTIARNVDPTAFTKYRIDGREEFTDYIEYTFVILELGPGGVQQSGDLVDVNGENALGFSGNGSATIKATSSNGPVEFSLDGIQYFPADTVNGDQYEKTLTGLYIGGYTAYVRDAAGCTNTTDFTIGVRDEYKDKYICSWRRNSNEYTLRIRERDFNGVSEEFRIQSARWFLGRRNDQIWKQIKGAYWEVDIIRAPGNTDDALEDLYEPNDRKYQGIIERNGKRFWIGWILPDLIQQNYKFDPVTFKVRIKDGLGELKEHLFESESGDKILGRRSIIEIVDICLDKLDFDLNVNSSADVYSVDHDPNIGPLAQTFVKSESFFGLNCYEVLERVLVNYQIFQYDYEWWIVPYNYRLSLNNRNFDGVNLSNEFEIDTTKILDKLGLETPHLSIIGRGDAIFESMNAYGSVDIVQDLGDNSQLIVDSDFSEWENNTTPTNWAGTAVATGQVLRTSSQTEDESFLTLFGNATSVTVGDYVECRPFEFNFNGSATGEKLTIFAKSKIDISDSIGRVIVPIRIHVKRPDGTDLYLANDLANYTTDPNERVQVVLTKRNEFVEYELQITPLSGTYDIRLYQGFDDDASPSIIFRSLTYDYFRCQFSINDQVPQKTTTQTIRNSSENVTFKPSELKIFLGTLPEFDNSPNVYLNGFLTSDGLRLGKFFRKDVEEEIEWKTVFADNVLNSFVRQPQKFSGRLAARDGFEFRFYDRILFSIFSDKYYKVNFWEADMTNEIYNVELIEVLRGASDFDSEQNLVLYTDGLPILLTDGTNLLLV